MKIQHSNKRSGESGNVLFLILIAVALFAALSYAVTQSTRTGGGSTENETNALSSASIAQYPASLRTSVVRMILNGTSIDDLAFNPPSLFGAVTTTRLVFHPSGGGGVYQTAVDVAPLDGNWYFNGNFDVPQIGIDGAGGNDLIAFLPGIGQSLCQKINQELNLVGTTLTNGVPSFAATTDADIIDNEVDTDTFPTTDQEDISNASNDFDGYPTGCFFEPTLDLGGGAGTYVFYSVLLER